MGRVGGASGGAAKDAAPPKSLNTMVEKTMSVLVAEDNPVTQMIIQALFKEFDIQLTQAFDGAQAVAKADSEKFDMIFMDMMMPVMDGDVATMKIRQGGGPNANVPIIAFTARDDSPNPNQLNNNGLNDLLSKPVTKNALYETIMKWTQKKKEG